MIRSSKKGDILQIFPVSCQVLEGICQFLLSCGHSRCIHRWASLGRFLWAKQRYFSLRLRHGRESSWRWAIMYNLSHRQHPFSDSVQFSSVAQSCPTVCDPMDHSTPDLPVHHQLPEFTQSHVHYVSDAIQPSHPLRPLLLLPSIFPSIRVFARGSALRIRWPKY